MAGSFFRPRRRDPRQALAARRMALEALEPRNLFAADLQAPLAPTISEITRDRLSPGYQLVLTGNAEPGATVTIHDANSRAVAAVTAAAGGDWNLSYQAQQVNGEFRYRATARDAAGNLSSNSAEAVFRPNFVLINIDDMRPEQLQYMQQTLNLLVQNGTTFNNSFVPTALSGPSRASLLTGKYAHDHGVWDQLAPVGGEMNFDDSSTLATWLQNVGYTTGWYGKVGTAFVPREFDNSLRVPPGWDEYHALAAFPANSGPNFTWFYNTALNVNGQRVDYPDNQYSTDILASGAATYIADAATDDPFFLYFAPFSGHSPYTPADRHKNLFPNLTFDRPPNFNEVESDLVSPTRTPHTADKIAAFDAARVNQLRSLQSVDEAVAQIYGAVAQRGDLDNTVFVFTGDNGLHWGEHAMFSTKNSGYEESIRVPLVIVDGRSPGQRTSNELAVNIDIAPTLAKMAGVIQPLAVDGRDLSELIRGSTYNIRDEFLIANNWSAEYGWDAWGYGHRSMGIRTDRYKYIEFESGHKQLFDLQADPYELNNLAFKPQHAATVAQLALRLQALRPDDNNGPLVSNLQLQWGMDHKGMPALRVSGSESDAGRGDRDVKTPEYYLDTIGAANSGKFLDATDQIFDEVAEDFSAQIPLATISKLAPGTHTVHVHGRDAVGNWGPFAQATFTLANPISLNAASDSGASQTDRVTLDATPTLHGIVGAGHSVVLYAVGPYRKQTFDPPIVQLGTATANAQGAWSLSPSLGAGFYRIMAVVYGTGGKVARVTSPMTLHVLAAVDAAGVLQVSGTEHIDNIVVDSRTAGVVLLSYNNVFVGTLPRPTQGTVVQLYDGSDEATVLGSLSCTLIGGDGGDFLKGGKGWDVLDGGPGFNRLYGGAGNDTYLFSPVTQTDKIKVSYVVDKVLELAGEGTDTLDFSNAYLSGSPPRYPSIQFDYTKTPFARFDLPANGWFRSVEVAIGGDVRNLEVIRGGQRADTFNLWNTAKVFTGQGNDLVTLPPQLNDRTMFLPIHKLSSAAGDGIVKVVLSANEGWLRVAAGAPAWITVSRNNTRSVQIVGTLSDINNFLSPGEKLSYFANPDTTSVEVSLSLSTADGVLKETDRYRFAWQAR